MSDSPILSVADLAQLVGPSNARRLVQHLHDKEEARKVLAEQEFQAMGRVDRAVDHFIDESNDGRIEMMVEPGAYVYWYLRSEEMGGKRGDFWTHKDSREWFLRKNPGCRVKNRTRNARSGFTGQVVAGSKYGAPRQEAAA